MVEKLVNINQLKNISRNFKERLLALEKIAQKKRGKIGIHNCNIYMSSNWFECIERAVFKENRHKSIEFLTQIIDDYIRFFQIIEKHIICDSSLEIDKNLDEIIKLKKDNIESINIWYCGLGYLKKMYVNDTTIFNNIKNIQDKLYFIAEKELYK